MDSVQNNLRIAVDLGQAARPPLLRRKPALSIRSTAFLF